jgi:hypothetical protein
MREAIGALLAIVGIFWAFFGVANLVGRDWLAPGREAAQATASALILNVGVFILPGAAAVGLAVIIALRRKGRPSSFPAQTAPSLGQKLDELDRLKASGSITEVEHAAARAAALRTP